ncbi:MAG: protein phosphatase 2C domain-containing protein [Isosphaeraceae bacterium]|nr:protein phosphatase 2C domain-containing protein [Isosphaeraceae bacterium]
MVPTEEFPAASSLTLVSGSLKLKVGVVSIVGNVRDHNEDNYYVPGRRSVRADKPVDPPSGEHATSILDAENVFVVADGMGGQLAGEHASAMAVEIIPRAIERRLPADELETKSIQGAIREAFAEANQEILGCSGAVSDYANMGTTAVLALFRHSAVYVAGIGDSRAYRLRAGRIERLTKDHSLADALVEAGTITEEELAHHKYKNVLYLYLGCKDARSGPEDVRVLDVRPGDRFLLASDGLTGVVRDEDLTDVLETVADPQRAAQTLIDRALSNESKDNVTALVIHVVSEDGRASSSAA